VRLALELFPTSTFNHFFEVNKYTAVTISAIRVPDSFLVLLLDHGHGELAEVHSECGEGVVFEWRVVELSAMLQSL
jgi:hypothetical protein